VIERAYCNPPGGKLKNRSLQSLFWQWCLDNYEVGNISSLVFLCFNLNAGPALNPHMLRFPRVYTTKAATSPDVSTSGRLKYVSLRGKLIEGLERDLGLEGMARDKKIVSLLKLPVHKSLGDDVLVQESNPTHPGMFILLPNFLNYWGETDLFRIYFEQFGTYAPQVTITGVKGWVPLSEG